MLHNPNVVRHRILLVLVACGPIFGQPYTISTIAGNGVAGITLDNPTSVAVDSAGDLYVADSSGNLYIADTVNHRIRRVDASTGLIDTIAGNGVKGFGGDGGSASAASISFPAGIAVDSSGKVYFSDESNNRIRVLTPVLSPAFGFRQIPSR